jgi:hypothetical protein
MVEVKESKVWLRRPAGRRRQPILYGPQAAGAIAMCSYRDTAFRTFGCMNAHPLEKCAKGWGTGALGVLSGERLAQLLRTSHPLFPVRNRLLRRLHHPRGHLVHRPPPRHPPPHQPPLPPQSRSPPRPLRPLPRSLAPPPPPHVIETMRTRPKERVPRPCLSVLWRDRAGILI